MKFATHLITVFFTLIKFSLIQQCIFLWASKIPSCGLLDTQIKSVPVLKELYNLVLYETLIDKSRIG